MAAVSKFRSGHLFFLGLGHFLRGHEGDVGTAVSAFERSVGAPGTTWPRVFLALSALRHRSLSIARTHARAALDLFSMLSTASLEGIFGASRIWSDWRDGG